MKKVFFGMFAVALICSTQAFAQETSEQCLDRCSLWYTDCVVQCPGIKARIDGNTMTEEEASKLIETDPCAIRCFDRTKTCSACDEASRRDFPTPTNKDILKAAENSKCQARCNDTLINEAWDACKIESKVAGITDDAQMARVVEELMRTDPCLQGYIGKIQACTEKCQ